MIELVTNPSLYQSSAYSGAASSSSAVRKTSFAETLQSYGTPSKSMDDIFKKASSTYQVPEDLIRAIAYHESRYQPEVVSSAGAMGVMQLMPATAQTMGVQNPFDAEQNVMGGTKLLSQLLNQYDGDLKLTLAAYGAGSGSVAKYNGVPPFEETQNFVQDIMSAVNQNVTVPTAEEAPSAVYRNVMSDIKSYRSYTVEDYKLFLQYLLDINQDNASNPFGIEQQEFPVLF